MCRKPRPSSFPDNPPIFFMPIFFMPIFFIMIVGLFPQHPPGDTYHLIA
jgi:hypothetical protein